MPVYLLSTLVVACFLQASQAVETAPPPAAKAAFASTLFDFGKIISGEVVKHSFVFTNTGGQNLQINGVSSTCGCAVINTWSRQVEPGQTGTIPIEIHSQNLDGQVDKEIDVQCNDPAQPMIRLKVKGTVWKPIEIIPPNAVFNLSLDAPSNLVRVARILNKTEQPLELSAPESDQPLITALLRTNQPGKEYQVTIRLEPPKTSGHIFGKVKLKTSLPQMPEITISTWALASPAVMVSPAILRLPAGPFEEKLSRTIQIRSYWDQPLRISELNPNAKGIEARIQELQPGRLYSITLVFPAGFVIKPGERIEVSVKSNHPQYSTIKVPITVD